MPFLLATASTALAGLDPAKAIAQYVHEVWRTENGLPHSTVTVVTQTRDGYLWIGGEEGLARFDGVKFATFSTDNTPALKNNVILALLEDRQGTLWVGTNGGLTRLRSGQDRTYTTHDGLASDVVTSLCQDRQGNLWIGTDGGGLSRFSGGAFQNYGLREGLAAANVFAIAEDRQGDVWFGTQAGLSRWSRGTLSTVAELRNRDIRVLLPEPAGALWIGTNGGGLIRMERGSLTTYTTRNGLRSNAVRSVLRDSQGTLWVATLGGGLHRFRDGRFESSSDREILSAGDIWWLFEDREGSLWMGTIGKGLHRLRESKISVLAAQQGLSDDATLGVFEDREGALWFGTKGAGVSRWKDGKVTAYTTRQGLSDPLVFSIAEDAQGDIWIGTRNGLNRLRQGKITVYTTRHGLPSNIVTASLLDRQGRMWFGTRNGLCQWDNGRCITYTTAQGLSSNFVISLRETADGSLWAGTAGGGVNRFRDGRFTAYGPNQGLSNGVVFDIYEDADGTLWFGTSGGGLNRLKDGRWTAIGVKDGLADNTVYRILEDGQSRFWLSSNKGISRVDRKALNDLAEGRLRSVHVDSYGLADGMKSQECNGGFQPAGWKARDGKLYFPTTQGVVLIDPSRLRGNTLTPPVVLEQGIVNGHPVDFSRGAVIPPGTGNLEFHYTAPSFIAPGRISFKYQLAGFDPDWVDAGTRREAYYTNIPPGRYSFRVMAANEGVWNKAGVTAAFQLQPHFYATTLFYLFCALLILSAGVTLHRLRVRWLTGREKELSARVQERTRELHEQILARDRAHEQLGEAQQRLIDLSRQAGMTEVATSVLHNVGNVLNSVNVSATLVADTVRDSKAEKLPALAELLHQHADHLEDFLRGDPKGQRVLPYIAKLGAHLQEERQTLLKELKLLTNHVEHIKEIVATQQSYATRSGIIEEVVLASLVEDAVRMVQPSMDRHAIALERDFEDLPPVLVDKHKLLQILINLLRNAKEAIKSGPDADRVIRVRIARHEMDRVRLVVQDSGVGLSPENLTRIFAHGFTTKAHGHGFGLHSGALAAREMGGALWAESEGLGLGATFILVFPLVEAETRQRIAA